MNIPSRKPVPERAGTPINHANAEKILGKAAKGKMVHGILDKDTGVYQCGGELKNFVYWKEQLVSIGKDVWDQIANRAKFIEIVDHKKNECYRTNIETAKKYGRIYNAGIGPRYGVPLECFGIARADGTLRKKATLRA